MHRVPPWRDNVLTTDEYLHIIRCHAIDSTGESRSNLSATCADFIFLCLRLIMFMQVLNPSYSSKWRYPRWFSTEQDSPWVKSARVLACDRLQTLWNEDWIVQRTYFIVLRRWVSDFSETKSLTLKNFNLSFMLWNITRQRE